MQSSAPSDPSGTLTLALRECQNHIGLFQKVANEIRLGLGSHKLTRRAWTSVKAAKLQKNICHLKQSIELASLSLSLAVDSTPV